MVVLSFYYYITSLVPVYETIDNILFLLHYDLQMRGAAALCSVRSCCHLAEIPLLISILK